MTELTPLARKLRTAYHNSATTNRNDKGAWWNNVAKVAEAFPALLDAAAAWDEGKHSEHAPACRLGDGDCTCPNPYRTEGETHE